LVIVGAGGFFAWQRFGHGGSAGGPASLTPFATQKVKDLTVNLIDAKGELKSAMNDIIIEFRDTGTGQLVDVGTVRFNLDMNMPGMVMHSAAKIEPTGTAGRYRSQIKPGMGGDWRATLHYDGPRGSGDVSFSVNVKQ
jgi:hypothetical protein